jgi:RNA polymerase sigma-70 factor (ECF subfamily)
MSNINHEPEQNNAIDPKPVESLDAVTANIPPPVNPQLFESEMNPHIDSLYRNALRLTGNSSDADDLVQDTYLRAFRFFHQYQPGTNAKAWLFRIMNTVFLNDYRKKSRQGDQLSYDELEDFYLYNRLSEESLSKEQTFNTANPEDVIVERIGIEEIQKAIRNLPTEFQETVALATLEDLSYQEISDILRIPIGTVRSRLSRGRKLLQHALWQFLGRSAPGGAVSEAAA